MLTFRQRRSFSGKNNYLGHDFQRRLVWGGMIVIIGAILIGQSTGKLPTFERLLRSGTDNDTDNRVVATRQLTDPNARGHASERAPVDGSAPQKPVARKRLFGDASPEWFLALEDDAVLRNDENDELFQLLKIMSDSKADDIRAASQGDRSFRQLHKQSDDYRGEIVTVRGIVRRIIPQNNPAKNEQGIKKLYEVWIEPDDSSAPIVIICPELPPDYPVGGDAEIAVEAHGYFYKRLGYASKEVVNVDPTTGRPGNVFRSAPAIIAKTVSWRRIENAANQKSEVDGPQLPFGIAQKYVFHVIGAGMVLMIMLAFWSYRMSRTSVLAHGPLVGRRRRQAEADPEPTDLNNLRF